MEKNSQTTVEITVEELTNLIKDYIKQTEDLDIEYINYRIETVYDSSDWQSRYPHEKLTKVICKTLNKNE